MTLQVPKHAAKSISLAAIIGDKQVVLHQYGCPDFDYNSQSRALSKKLEENWNFRQNRHYS